jgi:hypothetical protein
MMEEYEEVNIVQNQVIGLAASEQQPYNRMPRKLKSLRASGNQV